jgi:type II secretory pathway pseudopilin PulG
LLEIAVVVVIIFILASIIFPVASRLRARSQRMQCMANLRSLHTAAELYVQDHGSWPQIPAGEDDDDDQAYSAGWITALKPFGPLEKTWICPAIQSALGNPSFIGAGNARLDYVPMPFDDKPSTPHQSPQMPWFMETGNMHGTGNLVIFSDGSIRDLNTITQAAASAKSTAN